MRKVLKKIVVVLSLCAICFSTVACGGEHGTSSRTSGDDERPLGKSIVIYTGGSSEFTWTMGSKEDEIIEYIEQKYWEETGVSLDFQINYLGQDMKSKLMSDLTGGAQVDIAISHTRGGDGIDDWMVDHEQFYDIKRLLKSNGGNLLKAIKGDPLDSLTTYEGAVVGIPSNISPYKFGILVRKDYMEQVGYTDDAEKAKTEFKDGVNYELVDNLKSFEDMCHKINTITKNNFAVSGGPWDLEKVITLGSYAIAGHFSYCAEDYDNDGDLDIIPGSLSAGYGNTLKKMYTYASTGITSSESQSKLLSLAESDFISGKTGVFIQDPTVQHLITIARKTKQQNSAAEFTVLGALTSGDEGDSSGRKGFMSNTAATFCASITKSSNYAKEIISFLNWVYKNTDNYNLCRYGREGIDWIDNKDGTYSYPVGKEIYETEPAYEGILTLVENQAMSNMTYKGYTEEELHWINDIAGNKDNYIVNDVINYLLPTSTYMANKKNLSNSSNLWAELINPAYTGMQDPFRAYDATSTVYEHAISVNKTKSSQLIAFWTEYYNRMKLDRTDE